MTIQHHPSDESILAYANGSLGRALTFALAAHLEGCALCRGTKRLGEMLGGQFLETAPPAGMSDNSYANVLARLDTPMPQTRPAVQAAAGNVIDLPAALRGQRIGSRRWLAPGIWIRPVLKDRESGTRLYLLGAGPGKALPAHGHSGVEMTQVLQGEFFDGGTRYGPGDFVEASSDVEHSLLVGANSECICMIASQGVPRGLPGLLMRLIA